MQQKLINIIAVLVHRVEVDIAARIFFLFSGDRNTRRDPYRAIITEATREGGARIDIFG